MMVGGCSAIPTGEGDVGLPRTFVEAALIMVTCIALLKEVMWYVNQWISPSAPFVRRQQVAISRSDGVRGDGAAGRIFLYSGWASCCDQTNALWWRICCPQIFHDDLTGKKKASAYWLKHAEIDIIGFVELFKPRL